MASLTLLKGGLRSDLDRKAGERMSASRFRSQVDCLCPDRSRTAHVRGTGVGCATFLLYRRGRDSNCRRRDRGLGLFLCAAMRGRDRTRALGHSSVWSFARSFVQACPIEKCEGAWGSTDWTPCGDRSIEREGSDKHATLNIRFKSFDAGRKHRQRR